MKWLIDRIIELSVRNRFIVILGVAAVAALGVFCLYRTPVDAIPDLSENQVIVWADWPGRSPKEIEDQLTYPLSVNLQGLAGVKAVRATSEFGFSMINIIFDDSIEFYFARQRVLERLSTAGAFLPPGVVPYLAPDATALGQIFWYTVEGEGRSLDELRSIQDWYVRYQLNAVKGVAQVASVGGFVREYQVDVDPGKLRAYDVSLGQVFGAVMASNSSVGGKVIQKGEAEYLVRGTGWLRGVEDLRDVVVVERKGVPIRVEELAAVQLGPAFRRSVLEKDGREAVGGVVMMRYGENPLEVTKRVKGKIKELQPGLPPGVRVVPFYDRAPLIHDSIGTLRGALTEAILTATVVVILVLWHLRSAFVICVTLPLAVLVSFIFMYFLRIPSNIMSLAGIAISIGVLVDAGCVMVENAYNRLQERFRGGRVTGDTREAVLEACKVVGGPIFFSILIMLLSFLPVFFFGGLQGRMFNPLAFTKTFALIGVAVLAVTLLPAIIPTFVRGRLRSQEDVWLVRSLVRIYKPMLEFFLRKPDVIVVITGFFLVASLPIPPDKVPWTYYRWLVAGVVTATVLLVARHKLVCGAILFLVWLGSHQVFKPLGEEFMPPLDEGAIMDMPVTTPNASTTRAGDDLKERDHVMRLFPEVHQVVGKAGRAETPTDPAPPDMIETVVGLRPKDQWPRRKVNYGEAQAEAREVARSLAAGGILKPMPEGDLGNFANTAAMGAMAEFDRTTRELSTRRLREHVPQRGLELVRRLRRDLVSFLKDKRALRREPAAAEWVAIEQRLADRFAAAFDEWVLLEDVTRAAQRLVEWMAEKGAVDPRPDLLVEPETPLSKVVDPLRTVVGREKPTLFSRLRESLEALQGELRAARVKHLDWEIQDRAAGTLVWFLIEEAVAKAREQGLLAREPEPAELHALRDGRAATFGKGLFLWRKQKSDLVKEMDSELQVPGWGNIWTQPIINRVDMLATGVRTMVGVKISGPDLETIQKVANDAAAVLKEIHGAVDVFPDQIVGENYLEIEIDRKRAARYGVSVEEIQNVIEVALGGKEITLTVEGRERYPVRVRYPRDWREDEERVKSVLVPAGGKEGSGRLRQIPLSLLADIRVTQGPTMIKSENGRLRSYVQLNVRDRDVVGFVEEARHAVDQRVPRPPGVDIEWSGQFEYHVQAQSRLAVIFPAVVAIIFVILYLTYRDFSDTLMMFLAVPGAVAGGALFQYLCPILGITDGPVNYSVAVLVGYILCFGLATETGIVMLVYLREAIDKRGGMAGIKSEQEIREAVIEGAVHRLRPKLLTEGTTILALIPMLWATGAGAEFIRPMAAPVLGGILIADEVIDVLIPVLFYFDRCRRLRKRKAAGLVPVPAVN